MAVYRVDWQYIRDNLLPALADPGQNWELVALPVGGRQILSSVIGDRLQWRATYRTADYDYADWDLLEAMGAAVEKGLGEGIMLADLLAELDQIEQAILATACCTPSAPLTQSESTDDGTTVDVVGQPIADPGAPPVGGVDPTGNIDTDASGDVSQAEWDIWYCKLAHWVFQTMLDTLQITSAYWAFLDSTLVQTVVDWLLSRLVARIIPGPYDDIALFALADYFDWSTDMLNVESQAELQAAYSALSAAREDIICAVQGQTTVTGLLNALYAEIDARAALGVATFLKSGPWFAYASMAWNGLVTLPVATCDCPRMPGWEPVAWSGLHNSGGTFAKIDDWTILSENNANQFWDVGARIILNTVDCDPFVGGNVTMGWHVTGTLTSTNNDIARDRFLTQNNICDTSVALGTAQTDTYAPGAGLVAVDVYLERTITVPAGAKAISTGIKYRGYSSQGANLTFELVSMVVS